MKLSEAILLGSMDIPQTTGYAGCAIGAAVHAIGKNHHYDNGGIGLSIPDVACSTWPMLETDVEYPDGRMGSHNRMLVIVGYLNGFEKLNWSRERIAAWIATIEPQEESTSIHLLDVEEQCVSK